MSLQPDASSTLAQVRSSSTDRVSLRARSAPWWVWVSCLLLAFEVGGGFYEHVVIDLAWPAQLSLIQPTRGGVNRAPFWIIVHTALSFVLIGALWANWRNVALRRRIAWAFGLHILLRVWSFVYFIPAAVQFEAATALTEEQVRTWVLLSPWRSVFTFAALAVLWRPSDHRLGTAKNA